MQPKITVCLCVQSCNPIKVLLFAMSTFNKILCSQHTVLLFFDVLFCMEAAIMLSAMKIELVSCGA